MAFLLGLLINFNFSMVTIRDSMMARDSSGKLREVLDRSAVRTLSGSASSADGSSINDKLEDCPIAASKGTGYHIFCPHIDMDLSDSYP